MIKLSNPHLTRATVQLDQALDELDQTIIDRNVFENRLELSWKKLSEKMKALAKRWDQADHAAYCKLFAKHNALQKSLSKAKAKCSQARQNFHDKREAFDAVRNTLTSRMLGYAVDLDRLHRCQGALDRTFGQAVDRLTSIARLDSGDPAYEVREGEYDYISCHVPYFLAWLARLDEFLADDADYAEKGQRYRPVSFLEAGCGPGRNLMIARDSRLMNLGKLAGFDINPDLVALGQRAFGLTAELQVADAMDFDYGAWDVVYSFRPFSDARMQGDLEAYIARSMRKSAYLLAPLSQDMSLYPQLSPVGMDTNIWKKTG